MSDQSNVTSSTEPTLGNSTEARTPTGEIKDATTTSSTTTTQEPPNDKSADTSKTDKPATGAPDTYEFKTPDGTKLDAGAVEEITPIFKELGLSNDQGQRLVDFYNKQLGKVVGPEADKAIVDARNAQYMEQLKADKDIGGKLPQVLQDIGRAYDALGKPELVAQFKQAMESSPEGNNPAFIKMIHAFAQKVIEGKPANGAGPSPHGQTPGGQNLRPSAAEAMWPNLVKH